MMFNKTCPSCGSRAQLHDHHLVHDAHMGHHIYEFFHKSSFFRSHPVMAGVGMAGLGVATVIKLFEKHHYKCENGHHFKA